MSYVSPKCVHLMNNRMEFHWSDVNPNSFIFIVKKPFPEGWISVHLSSQNSSTTSSLFHVFRSHYKLEMREELFEAEVTPSLNAADMGDDELLPLVRNLNLNVSVAKSGRLDTWSPLSNYRMFRLSNLHHQEWDHKVSIVKLIVLSHSFEEIRAGAKEQTLEKPTNVSILSIDLSQESMPLRCLNSAPNVTEATVAYWKYNRKIKVFPIVVVSISSLLCFVHTFMLTVMRRKRRIKPRYVGLMLGSVALLFQRVFSLTMLSRNYKQTSKNLYALSNMLDVSQYNLLLYSIAWPLPFICMCVIYIVQVLRFIAARRYYQAIYDHYVQPNESLRKTIVILRYLSSKTAVAIAICTPILILVPIAVISVIFSYSWSSNTSWILSTLISAILFVFITLILLNDAFSSKANSYGLRYLSRLSDPLMYKTEMIVASLVFFVVLCIEVTRGAINFRHTGSFSIRSFNSSPFLTFAFWVVPMGGIVLVIQRIMRLVSCVRPKRDIDLEEKTRIVEQVMLDDEKHHLMITFCINEFTLKYCLMWKRLYDIKCGNVTSNDDFHERWQLYFATDIFKTAQSKRSNSSMRSLKEHMLNSPEQDTEWNEHSQSLYSTVISQLYESYIYVCRTREFQQCVRDEQLTEIPMDIDQALQEEPHDTSIQTGGRLAHEHYSLLEEE